VGEVTITAQRSTTSLARVELLGIGAFSRRSRLSPKALRLYDRIGLLTPASVDEANGYRRYREAQLATARLIALLRRLDMPLAARRYRDLDHARRRIEARPQPHAF
jgi:MerR family regulatory protein